MAAEPHPVNEHLAGWVYAGEPLIAPPLQPGEVIKEWQAQWLETAGYSEVLVTDNVSEMTT